MRAAAGTWRARRPKSAPTTTSTVERLRQHPAGSAGGASPAANRIRGLPFPALTGPPFPGGLALARRPRVGEGVHDGVHAVGIFGVTGQPDRAGVHELRRPGAGLHTWTLDEEASAAFFRQAVELGVTFWDTANVYQQGSSEEFVGRAIRRVLPAGGHRPGHQGVRADARRPRGQGCREGHPRTVRCVAAPVGHRLDRPVLHPPLRPTRLSRRPWKPSTIWSGRKGPPPRVRPRCGPGSSPRCRPLT